MIPDLFPGDRRWVAQARCQDADLDIFFPSVKGSSREARAAKQICADCPVQAECLDYALAHGEKYGIWGGTTEKERRRLARDRAARRAA